VTELPRRLSPLGYPLVLLSVALLAVACTAPSGGGGPSPAVTGPPAVTETPSVTGNPPSTESAGESGVAGHTVVDGGCPVEVEGSPCPSRPVTARLTAVSVATGVQVGATTSDADGRFRMALPPGSYRLHAVNLTGAPFPRTSPVDFEVTRARYTEVTVHFLSGIQ
jgi:hypothetical protein